MYRNYFIGKSSRFSFGLGKRGVPTAAVKDKRLHELLVRINKWGFSGIRFYLKRILNSTFLCKKDLMDCSREATVWSLETSLKNELFGNIFLRGLMNQSSKETPIHLVGKRIRISIRSFLPLPKTPTTSKCSLRSW